MFKAYIKASWRHLKSNRAFSILNISGLAIGMSVALLIGLWVYYQYSFDRFLPGNALAYKVKIKKNENGGVNVSSATALPLADAIRQNVAGIQYVAASESMGSHLLARGEKKIVQTGTLVGEDFLKIFRFPFLKGSSDYALHDAYSIVLTQAAAFALFGSEDAVGKTVHYDNSHDLTVTGVLKDIPANSTFQFQFLISFSYALQNDAEAMKSLHNWRDHSYQTYFALAPNVTYAQVEPVLRGLEKKYNPEDYRVNSAQVMAQPMKDWHLYAEYVQGVAGGLVNYVRMFGLIGLLVLAIACINCMNLSTAQSAKRAKEIGVRKVMGSGRGSLIFQFLTEAIVLTTISFLLCLAIVILCLPAFNTLTQSHIDIPYASVSFWLIAVGYIILTGFLAGIRPAFYLSSFQPVKVLKGAVRTGESASLSRKIMVVAQFSCSVALIISTVIIYQQVQHGKERPMGYDIQQLVATPVNGSLQSNYAALKNDLLQSGYVTGVTKSSSPVTEIWGSQRIDNWERKLPGESLGLPTVAISDGDYFKTLGMRLIKGRDFEGSLAADSLSVVLNEAAVKQMRFIEPINQIITWHDNPQHVKVIGVVKDAMMSSPFAAAQPTIFTYIPDWANIITYRLSAKAGPHEALAKIGAIFAKYNPAYPFDFQFADEGYASKFTFQVLLGKLAGLFAALAIFISCLGLLGLSAYMAEQRAKEIGIRKVLGASISQLWFLLSKEFVLLVCISCLIAAPISWYYLQAWLQQYEYRISIEPFVFVVAAVVAVMITLLTVSFQAIRAAAANPIRSLRSE